MAPTEDERNTEPFRVLSLDGGELGSRVFAQILLLKHVLEKVKSKDGKGDKDCDGDGLISDSFNFIMGTGFGGIIAMLATKLPMRKIMDFYESLYRALLSKPEWREPSANNMEANAITLHRLVEDFLPDLDLDEPIFSKTSTDQGTCYTLTCAVIPGNAAYPRLFTSYKPRYIPTPCTLRQAIELSLADMAHLPPFELGNDNERFVGTTHRFSNPLFTALKEVKRVFGLSQPVNYIVSIGSGMTGAERDLQVGASDWERRCSKVDGLFYRFDLTMEEDNDLDSIQADTTVYLAEVDTVDLIDTLARRERSELIEIGQLLFPVTDHDKNELREMDRFPPNPLHAFGREEEKHAIVTSLLQRGSSIIYGTGGVGKTWLANTVLHDTQLQHVPRYFFDCRDTPMLGFLYQKFANSLGIKFQKSASSQDMWSAILNKLESAGGVVCLDNVETLWDQDELRDEIGTMLTTLASLDTISLLVTMRTAEPPGDINWITPISLLPLSHRDAFQLFQSISTCADDDEYAWKLSDCTDFLPLAVELLGSLADGQVETTQDVWERWIGQWTSNVPRIQLDLNCSIELTLGSPRLKNFPTAKSTLHLLSLLPGGLDTCSTFFTFLQDGIEDLTENLRILTHLGLVHIDNTKRYRLLSPIAQYAADNLSSSFLSHDQTCLIQSSVDFVTFYDPSPQNHLFVPLELSNVYSVLTYAFETIARMDDIVAEGAIFYAEWVDSIGIHGDSLLHTILSAMQCSTQLLGEASMLQGNRCMKQGRLDEAEQLLNKGLLFFDAAHYAHGEGGSLLLLGDLYGRQGRVDEAEESVSIAIPLFQQSHNILAEGKSYDLLGGLYIRQGRLEEAEESQYKAIRLFQQGNHILEEGIALKSLGDLYGRHDRIEDAEGLLNKAILCFQQIHHVLGEADSLDSLSDLYMLEDRLDEAEETLGNAIPLFQEGHNLIGEGNSRKSLGDLYIRQSRLDEAEASLNDAASLFQRAPDVLGEGNARDLLGDLYMRQERFDEAQESFHKAILLFQQAHDALGEGNSCKSLGQLYFLQRDFSKAQASIWQSIHLYQQCDHLYSEAYSRKWLGIIHERIDELDEAEEHYRKAIDLHSQCSDESGAKNTSKLLGKLLAAR